MRILCVIFCSVLMEWLKYTSTLEQMAGKYAIVFPRFWESTRTNEFPRNKFGHAYLCDAYVSLKFNFLMPLKTDFVKHASFNSIGSSILLCAKIRISFELLINLKKTHVENSNKSINGRIRCKIRQISGILMFKDFLTTSNIFKTELIESYLNKKY